MNLYLFCRKISILPATTTNNNKIKLEKKESIQYVQMVKTCMPRHIHIHMYYTSIAVVRNVHDTSHYACIFVSSVF